MKKFLFYMPWIFILFATLAVIPNGYAYESRFLSISLGNICENPDPKNIVGTFNVKNLSDQTLQIKVESQRTNEYEFLFVSEQKVLRPGEVASVHFRGAIFVDGKYQIIPKVDLIRSDGAVAGWEQADLYYSVANGVVKASNYNDLFLQPDLVDKVRGNSFNVGVDDGKTQRGVEYVNPLPSVQRMIEQDPGLIFRIPTFTADPKNCPGNCPCPGGGSNCPAPNSLKTMPPAFARNEALLPSAGIFSNTVASGVFSFKGMDNLLHPAFGWRVKAWRNMPGSGWNVLAEDWIQFDGTWTLHFPSGAGDTQFQYVAANRFFTPMTSSEDTYRWVGPVHASLPLSYNEGSWIADTSTGNVRGLGEIYYQGMYLWSKLYWEGEINPLRNNSVKVYFPNTTYDCGDGTGVPWSCASQDGRIWLIPAHASRNGVIQHELSHQINYQYWGNALPPGSGGSHSLGSCYNPGLALIEGFADFMVFWTQAGRGDDPSTNFDFRVEDPSSFACAAPFNTNESWVAAAFWDLHDTHSDGVDNLWFIHPGAVPGIFLRGGLKNGMADLHAVYRNAANVEHRTIVDAIFTQNKITH